MGGPLPYSQRLRPKYTLCLIKQQTGALKGATRRLRGYRLFNPDPVAWHAVVILRLCTAPTDQWEKHQYIAEHYWKRSIEWHIVFISLAGPPLSLQLIQDWRSLSIYLHTTSATAGRKKQSLPQFQRTRFDCNYFKSSYWTRPLRANSSWRNTVHKTTVNTEHHWLDSKAISKIFLSTGIEQT